MTWAGFTPRTVKIVRNKPVQRATLKKVGTFTASHSVKDPSPPFLLFNKKPGPGTKPPTSILSQTK